MWLLLYCACFTPAVATNYPLISPFGYLLVDGLVAAQPYGGAFRRHVGLLVIALHGFDPFVVFGVHHLQVVQLLTVHVRAANAAAFPGVIQTNFLDDLRLLLADPPVNEREHLAPLILWFPVLDAMRLVCVDTDDA